MQNSASPNSDAQHTGVRHRRYAFRAPALLLAAIAASTVGCTQAWQAGASAGIRELEELQSANRIRALIDRLQPSSRDASVDKWLSDQAAVGHVFAYYELADRLRETDSASALRFFARGRLYRILNETECRDKRLAAKMGTFLDVRYRALDELQRHHDFSFADAIEQALKEDDRNSPRPSQQWICSPDKPDPNGTMLLPQPMRDRERARQRAFLLATGTSRLTEARLNANLNPDDFPIVRIPDPLHGRDANRMEEWVNNDVLLFLAYEKRFVDGPAVLFQWNASTGKLHRYGTGGIHPCAFAGYVSYVANGKFYEGEFGKEKPNESVDLKKQINRNRCRYVPDAAPQGEIRLDMGGSLKHVTLPKPGYVFYPEGRQTAVQMPFERLGSVRIRFSPLLAATVVPRQKTIVGESTTERLWILYPDGRVRHEDFGAGPWHAGSPEHLPVRGGWIIPARTRGIYLVQTQRTVKIISGDATGAAVSPDGCNVAVRINVGRETGSPYRVIQLCGKTRGGNDLFDPQ